ncbi:50S ribosomal protein L20 [Halothermothrix orenii]|uniref:Large ribosomal subunit protein bL20 n=1 Tax=Halothermothrix orenii (strain H 168 / OCM 544 / DSM 9562) TaxID=373903 RepID=B8D291_HALOH|nr:50S ribosomal protein L20 [Halothermothrix orenii]ACL69318.1 ribosomal protein L20 [Halothermothrix orenii H 168]
MPRVKRGYKARRRRKKILKMAKGYFGGRSKLFRPANQAVMKSLHYAYRDRRARKRDFRKLWITRINAAARQEGISYSKFIHGLKKADIQINRKMLADMAIKDKESFSELAAIAKKELGM